MDRLSLTQAIQPKTMDARPGGRPAMRSAVTNVGCRISWTSSKRPARHRGTSTSTTAAANASYPCLVERSSVAGPTTRSTTQRPAPTRVLAVRDESDSSDGCHREQLKNLSLWQRPEVGPGIWCVERPRHTSSASFLTHRCLVQPRTCCSL
jgi:hypothetical protein